MKLVKKYSFGLRLTLVVLVGTLAMVGCGGKKKQAAMWPLALLGGGNTDSANSGSGSTSTTGNGSTISTTGTGSTFTIGGTVTGLTASGLVLQNNAGNNLTVSSGATTFTFTTPISTGATYAVTVQTQPTGLTCTVTNGAGNASANVNNVALSCVLPPITRNWGTFTDNGDGTVKLEVTAGTFGGQTYTAQTLIWMKCSHGQAWKSSTNDCTQTGTEGTSYGATIVQYCNANDQSCNDAGTGLLNGTGTSSAYTACNALNFGVGTYGKTNWRVPTKNEYKTLINCIDNTMPGDYNQCGSSNYTIPSINNLFPNTVTSNYWSSSTAAYAFAWRVDFYTGVVGDNLKAADYLYVRCVSGP